MQFQYTCKYVMILHLHAEMSSCLPPFCGLYCDRLPILGKATFQYFFTSVLNLKHICPITGVSYELTKRKPFTIWWNLGCDYNVRICSL